MTVLNSFGALKVEPILVENMTCQGHRHDLQSSNQVSGNMWIYDFYDMTLHH